MSNYRSPKVSQGSVTRIPRILPKDEAFPFTRIAPEFEVLPHSSASHIKDDWSLLLSTASCVKGDYSQHRENATDAGGGHDWIFKCFRELVDLRNLRKGWDSYDADAPNLTSIYYSNKILSALLESNLAPSKISPSVEGGVGIIFSGTDRYADIECLNSGVILAVTYSSDSSPKAWELSGDSLSVQESIERIRQFLNDEPTREDVAA